MPDPIFADSKLVDLYDVLDDDRSDLEVYAALVDEIGARRVLDIGCGTGTFACLLAGRGVAVIGVDPAEASLDVARRKPHAATVRWVHGDAAAMPAANADVATMTGNVAQVFVDDNDWLAALQAARAALRPGGSLVFEVRDPARRAWTGWTREATYRRIMAPDGEPVRTWVELTAVQLPFVSFRHVFEFEHTSARMVSDSTLRFRERDEILEALVMSGFHPTQVRDAPDREGLELVFIARRQERLDE